MADQFLRIGGRGVDGKSKGLLTDNKGNLSIGGVILDYIEGSGDLINYRVTEAIVNRKIINKEDVIGYTVDGTTSDTVVMNPLGSNFSDTDVFEIRTRDGRRITQLTEEWYIYTFSGYIRISVPKGTFSNSDDAGDYFKDAIFYDKKQRSTEATELRVVNDGDHDINLSVGDIKTTVKSNESFVGKFNVFYEFDIITNSTYRAWVVS